MLFFSDITQMNLEDYPSNIRSLICKAEKVGSLTQVNSDGFTSNKRLSLAMGLATIHIAQYLEVYNYSLQYNLCTLFYILVFTLFVHFILL